MLRGASVKSRLRRIDCAARCDPLKAGRISRTTQTSHQARRERTRCLLRAAKRKAYLNRMLSARRDCSWMAARRRADKKIRCVECEGRFAASLDVESRQTGGYACKQNRLRLPYDKFKAFLMVPRSF